MSFSTASSGSPVIFERTSEGSSRKRRRLSLDDSPQPSFTRPSAFSQPALPATSRIRPRQHKPQVGPLDGLAETEINNGKVVDARSSFATLDVAPWLIASLANMEIRRPTAIQKNCIPKILAGRDVIGSSRTGSGKTVAFAVPVIQRWAEDPTAIYALVLTPTRELALQIFEQFVAISASQAMKVLLVTGGTELREQAIALANRPHLVIATPGRLADHINTSGEDTVRGLRRVRAVVLDEADRLLAAGPGSMLPDIETCLSVLPSASERQTCLFTATLTPEVTALREMPRPKNRPPVAICEVDATSTFAVPPLLRQTYLQVPVTYREAYLHGLLLTPRSTSKNSIIVFCNRTKTADLMERILRGLDHSVVSLHSKLPQRDRNANLSQFRASAVKILVATDVASRGLDIPDVGLVINYDVPRNPDDYIHRVGRTARAGRVGESVTLVGQRDVALVLAIEARTGCKMVEYQEDGINLDQRVADEALRAVGEKKREVVIAIDEGRDVKGNRVRGRLRRLE